MSATQHGTALVRQAGRASPYSPGQLGMKASMPRRQKSEPAWGLPCAIPASTAEYMFSYRGSRSSEMAEAVGAPLLHSEGEGPKTGMRQKPTQLGKAVEALVPRCSEAAPAGWRRGAVKGGWLPNACKRCTLPNCFTSLAAARPCRPHFVLPGGSFLPNSSRRQGCRAEGAGHQH